MNPSMLASLKSLLARALACVAVLGVGCGEPQSSSSTNWLRCKSDADCALVASAVCRNDSVCVDSAGRPIPVSAVSSGPSGSAGQGAAEDAPSTPAGSGGSENGAGASAGGAPAAGAPANMAGSAGSQACPAGPPPANTTCSPEGLVCEYAGSPVGVLATCQGGVWVHDSAGSDPTFVCPSTLPKTDSNCPKPPTPEYSPLVCIFDCAQQSCQNGTGCGAYQANCNQDTQSGEWRWSSMPRFSCTI